MGYFKENFTVVVCPSQ